MTYEIDTEKFNKICFTYNKQFYDFGSLSFEVMETKNNTDDFKVDYSLIALMASLLYSFNVKAVPPFLVHSFHSWFIKSFKD